MGLGEHVEHLRARLTGGVVLCYHLVDAGVGGPIDLELTTFKAHLARLMNADVRPLHDVVAGGRGIALTFDDAFANFHDVIWPVLQWAGLPATLFVPTGFVDGTHGSPLSTAPHLRPCTWDQLRAMRDEGLAIGSHSHSHQNLRRLDAAAIDADLAAANARLRDELGLDDVPFCYPQAKWSEAAEDVVARHHSVAVIGGGLRVDKTLPLRVRRTSVVRGGPSLGRILGWPLVPRELIADRVRQWRP